MTFDEAIEQLLNETEGGELLTIPGIYEVVSEHFNNAAIKLMEEDEEEEDQEDCEDCGGSGLITADNGEEYSCDADVHPYVEAYFEEKEEGVTE